MILTTLNKALIEANLLVAYVWFSKENKAKNLPYHNNIHAKFMCRATYSVGLESELNWFELKSLVLAAMFHDFNHSGGKLSDSENIKEAYKGLDNLWIAAQHSELLHNEIFSYNLILDAKKIISVTQYPYVNEPKSESEKIIRDCDMLQLLDPEYGDSLIFHKLPIEINQDKTKFLKNCTRFYENISFNSKWAINKEKELRNQLNNKVKNKLNEK